MTLRSIRKFETRQIPDAFLEKIIRAGTYAPASLALQLWGFVVVQDPAFLNRVSDYCKPIMISLMKEANNGMPDAFRALLEGGNHLIYYHAPTAISPSLFFSRPPGHPAGLCIGVQVKERDSSGG
ncbi:MAG: nitroreductase family protein [Methanoregula sp.]|nr:nitroreductase family protein [Methanoregula sp.]